jgi:ribulose-5-phosphate 4-epimerase/fuculose-1-phosphate aldolase
VDGEAILITPRKGPALIRSPREILRSDRNGKETGTGSAKPNFSKRLKETVQLPLEIFLHTEIYHVRPEVNAICRFHGKFANVLSILRRTLRPVHELALPIGPEVPLFDSAELIASHAIGRRMVAALGSARALLLRGNGQLTVGATIEEAVVNAIHLETSAELQWRALAVGDPVWIEGEEFIRLAKREYEAVLRPWNYYLDQSRRSRPR